MINAQSITPIANKQGWFASVGV